MVDLYRNLISIVEEKLLMVQKRNEFGSLEENLLKDELIRLQKLSAAQS